VFAAPAGSADASVTASFGQVGTYPPGRQVFESGALWRLYDARDGYVVRLASPLRGPIPYAEAWFAPGFGLGKVVLRRSAFQERAPLYPLEYPLDELIMINLLAGGLGVMVHACGISDAGEGLLFVGQSGAGKTTTARLWQAPGEAKVLSDDRIILRAGAGEVRMYGTPWHGEARLALPDRAPLRRVFFLRHGPENRLVELGKAEVVSRFMACSFLPFYRRDAMEFTLGFFEDLASRTPCYDLSFAPDETAVSFVQRLGGSRP
jgi:hypothetical protein